MNDELFETMMTVYSDQNDDELYHWGIKGMKWGLRKYQNSDGSLTAEGRERYLKNPDEHRDGSSSSSKSKASAVSKVKKAVADSKRKKSLEKAREAKAKKAEETAARKAKSNKELTNKDISKMSDKEIKERMERYQLEKQLKDILPQDVEFGNKFTRNFKNAVANGFTQGIQQGTAEVVKNTLVKLTKSNNNNTNVNVNGKSVVKAETQPSASSQSAAKKELISTIASVIPTEVVAQPTISSGSEYTNYLKKYLG